MQTAAHVVVQESAQGPLEIREVKLPSPREHEVEVKMLASGLCRSQLMWMNKKRSNPYIFGHEGYGVVTKTGALVSNIKPGDHVLVTWIPREATDGRQAEVASISAPDGNVWTSPNVYTWADYIVVDELWVVPLDSEKLHFPAISLVGCAVPTGAGTLLDSFPVSKKDKIVVIGLGGVGQSAVLGARAMGCDQIIAIDVSLPKLKWAQELGALRTIDGTQENVEKVVEQIFADEGQGAGADIVLDCVGNSTTINQAIRMVRPGAVGRARGGKIALVGVPPEEVTVDLNTLLMRQGSLLGTMAGSSTQATLKTFFDWQIEQRINVEELVTDTYAFEDIAEAVDRLAANEILGRAIVTM